MWAASRAVSNAAVMWSPLPWATGSGAPDLDKGNVWVLVSLHTTNSGRTNP